MKNKVKVAFCVPNMIIGGVETVFFNTINELAKNPKLDVIIITHAQIREPLYANWLKSYPKKSVYVYYPLCNWFEDLAPKCRGILKPIRTGYLRYAARQVSLGMQAQLAYKRCLQPVLHPCKVGLRRQI